MRTRVRVEPTADSAYGPVEIAWFDDRLQITARGAGRARIEAATHGVPADDLVLELRPPDPAELIETLPGAD